MCLFVHVYVCSCVCVYEFTSACMHICIDTYMHTHRQKCRQLLRMYQGRRHGLLTTGEACRVAAVYAILWSLMACAGPAPNTDAIGGAGSGDSVASRRPLGQGVRDAQADQCLWVARGRLLRRVRGAECRKQETVLGRECIDTQTQSLVCNALCHVRVSCACVMCVCHVRVSCACVMCVQVRCCLSKADSMHHVAKTDSVHHVPRLTGTALAWGLQPHKPGGR